MNAGKGDKPRPVDKEKYDNNYKKYSAVREKVKDIKDIKVMKIVTIVSRK